MKMLLVFKRRQGDYHRMETRDCDVLLYGHVAECSGWVHSHSVDIFSKTCLGEDVAVV